jgi:hypothetical protein
LKEGLILYGICEKAANTIALSYQKFLLPSIIAPYQENGTTSTEIICENFESNGHT